MSFQEAVRICLQQRYAEFSGRSRRSEFWFFVLFSAIVRTIANVVDAILHTNYANNVGGLVSTLVFLALVVPSLAVSVRRLHDTGRSGWWLLIGLIPLVGIIVLIVWWAQDSHPDNQYGPNPKGYAEVGNPGGGYGPPPAPGQGYGQPQYPDQGHAAPPAAPPAQPYGTPPPPPAQGYGAPDPELPPPGPENR